MRRHSATISGVVGLAWIALGILAFADGHSGQAVTDLSIGIVFLCVAMIIRHAEIPKGPPTPPPS